MWSSRASTKETAASLKKFYKCLTEAGIVEIADYQFLLSEIKHGMPEWLGNYSDELEWYLNPASNSEVPMIML